MPLSIIIIALVIIAGLIIYSTMLFMQLKAQSSAQTQSQKEQQTALQAHDAKLLTSVTMIVKAMQQQQCGLSEGCWRLSVLLDSLKTVAGFEHQFSAIYGFYNKIKHMAILDNRKKLEKKQRMKEDYERIRYEAEYQDAVMRDLALLAKFADNQLAQTKEKVH